MVEILCGFLSVFIVTTIVIGWRAVLSVSIAYHEKEDWYKKQIKAAVELQGKTFHENMELRSRNTDLEELIDTLHDERAQTRRWFTEAPKWMAEPTKPE